MQQLLTPIGGLRAAVLEVLRLEEVYTEDQALEPADVLKVLTVVPQPLTIFTILSFDRDLSTS